MPRPARNYEQLQAQADDMLDVWHEFDENLADLFDEVEDFANSPPKREWSEIRQPPPGLVTVKQQCSHCGGIGLDLLQAEHNLDVNCRYCDQGYITETRPMNEAELAAWYKAQEIT